MNAPTNSITMSDFVSVSPTSNIPISGEIDIRSYAGEIWGDGDSATCAEHVSNKTDRQLIAAYEKQIAEINTEQEKNLQHIKKLERNKQKSKTDLETITNESINQCRTLEAEITFLKMEINAEITRGQEKVKDLELSNKQLQEKINSLNAIIDEKEQTQREILEKYNALHYRFFTELDFLEESNQKLAKKLNGSQLETKNQIKMLEEQCLLLASEIENFGKKNTKEISTQVELEISPRELCEISEISVENNEDSHKEHRGLLMNTNENPEAVQKEDLKGNQQVSRKAGTSRGRAPQSTKYKICSFCPMTFLLASKLKRHEIDVHGDKSRLDIELPTGHKCSEGGKTFKTKINLNGHESTLIDERPFSCKWKCGSNFKSNGNCAQHEKSCIGMLHSRE